MGCYARLQGIFLTQRSNPGLLHCRRILYQLSHQESPNLPGDLHNYPYYLLFSFFRNLHTVFHTPIYIPNISVLGISQVAQWLKKKKNPAANAGDERNVGLISGSGRSPGEGNDNPLQYSCLENPVDRRVWQGTVHRDAKSRDRKSVV